MRFRFAPLAAALAASFAISGTAGALELTYGTYTSPTQTTFRTGSKPFLDRITEQTNGEITWETFTGGAMGGPKDLLSNVGNGILDASGVVDIYVKAQLPHSSLLSSMLTIGSSPLAMAAANNEMQLLHCPECVNDRTKANVVGLAWSATGTYHLICKEPVHTLADIQGKKIRAASGMGRALQTMGAVAVSITTAEMYEAMQRGQVDCVAGAAAWISTYNLKDFAKSITSYSMGSYFGTMMFGINKDVWESLTPEQQKIMRDNASRSVADILFAYEEDHIKGLEDLKAAGGAVYDVDDAFKKAFEETRDHEIELAIETGKKGNIDGAEEMVNTFIGLVKKWEKIVDEIGDDKEAYKEALDREIFSKI